MWKKILLFCAFIAFCFMLPSVFIDFAKVPSNNINIENNEKESGEISKIENQEMIKLLLKESNQIIEISMDDYIKGVVLRRNANNI